MNAEENLKGLKGWLFLVGLGLIVYPVRLAFIMGPLFYNMFTDGSFEYLTTPGTESYSPLWKPILIFEGVFNVLMILFSFFVTYLFFKKNYQFPKAYIVFLILPLVLMPTDAWLGSFVVKDEPMFDPETSKEIIRSFIAAVIWIPYMLLSKRVKATFVEGKPTVTEAEL
ncbi:DUF2569 domain-containing protein [Leptospira brenneri]|uniref:DUF2569 domain-containing protein n=1 Tax=Leptospira brenneri TaxID=2023182 RepID=A0A2M9Y3Y8_9LEPT|nr:DUF2569 domain-containing protein [Leptospira brenneri]PJZ46106.1 hypothetical protein CH361_09105 [Leptospira brenneri]TGK91235.1 DUF2569 domain-containing protein [Leptospira brenneri]